MNLRAAVAAFCLLAATAGSAANIWVEHPISERRIGSVASTHLVPASAASDGKNFLVVWSDDRAGMPVHRAASFASFATRVDGNGKTLDVPNIQLPFSGNLLWTGSAYLLYSYAPATFTTPATPATSFYTRLDILGRPLDLIPLKLPVASEAMAFNGKYYIAVDDLNVYVLSANLSLIRTFHVFNSPQYGSAVAASNGDTFVVAGSEVADGTSGGGTRIVVLDGNGSLLDNRLRTGINDYLSNLRIATDGASYAIVGVWNSKQFQGTMLDRNGAPGNDLPAFAPTYYYTQVAFAWMGNEYQLISEDPHGMYMITPISRDGVALNSTPIWKAGMQVPVHFTLASNGERSLLLWSHFVGGSQNVELYSGEIYDDPVDLTDGLATSFLLGEGALNQEMFSAATKADGTALVTWRERVDANDPLVLYAARVAPDGTILDPQSIRIAGVTCDGTRPAVTTDGRDFLVASSDPGVGPYGGICNLRLVTAGGELSEEDIPLGLFLDAEGAFFTGKSFIILGYGNSTTYQLLPVRVGADGSRLDPVYQVPAPLPFMPSYAGVDAVCDLSGCFSAGASQKNGILSLYLNTLTDPSGAIERTDPELIASVPEPAIDWHPMAMVLPGSPRRVIYQRAAIEPELGGAMRIFVRTMLLRPRPARH